MFKRLSEISWKKYGSILFKLCLDLKILGLIALNFLLLYAITWDTVLRPGLVQLASRETALSVERKALGEKGSLQRQYLMWERELKDLKTEIIPIPPGDSSKLVSVSEAASVLSLAQGNLRDLNVLPLLQPPHNIRDKVTLIPLGNTTLDLLLPDTAPDPPLVTVKDSAAAHAITTSPTTPPDTTVKPPSTGDELSSLPAERYDYELKMSGTYPALMDFLNELVLYKKLVKINQVEISSDATIPQPDARENPDYPLKLNMAMSLSLFLYDENPK